MNLKRSSLEASPPPHAATGAAGSGISDRTPEQLGYWNSILVVFIKTWLCVPNCPDPLRTTPFVLGQALLPGMLETMLKGGEEMS